MNNIQAVGIVIPTLGDRVATLLGTLDSLRRQIPQPFLVVVRPPTAGNIDPFIDSLVDAIIDDPGVGLSQAINIGMRSLPSTVLFANWLGDDDELTPGSLAATSGVLFENQSVSLVYGACAYVNDSGVNFLTLRPGRLASRTVYFLPNRIPQPGALFRVADFWKVGGVCDELKYAMDLDLWFKLLKVGKARSLREVLSKYCWHDASLSSGNQYAAFEESRHLRLSYSSGFTRVLAFAVDALGAAWTGRVKNSLDRKLAKRVSS